MPAGYPKVTKDSYPCKWCGQQFPTSAHLMGHMALVCQHNADKFLPKQIIQKEKIVQCKWCGTVYPTVWQKNGHQTMCKLNPQYYNIVKSISDTIINLPKRTLYGLIDKTLKIYTVKCVKCKTPYQIVISYHNYRRYRYFRYCSVACKLRGVKLTRRHRRAISINLKSSQIFQAYLEKQKANKKPILNKVCTICGCKYTTTNQHSIYCGRLCRQKGQFFKQQRRLLLLQMAKRQIGLSGWYDSKQSVKEIQTPIIKEVKPSVSWWYKS